MRGRLLQREVRAGHEALLDILGVLEPFQDREGQPERRRGREAPDDEAVKVGLLRALRRNRHGEAAGEQDGGVTVP